MLHVLPNRFHRIRYYRLFANRFRAANLERCRALLPVPAGAARPAAASFNLFYVTSDEVNRDRRGFRSDIASRRTAGAAAQAQAVLQRSLLRSLKRVYGQMSADKRFNTG